MKLFRTLAPTLLVLLLAIPRIAAQTTATTDPVGLYTFPFPQDSMLAGQTGPTGEKWEAVGPAGPGIRIGHGSLTFPGLAAASGNRAVLSGATAATGARIGFGETFKQEQGTTSLYYSLVLQGTDLTGLGPDPVVLAGLSDSSGPSAQVPSILGAVLVAKVVDGQLVLGFRKNSFMDWCFDWFHSPGPHLIVVGYKIVPGEGNDEVRFWVDPQVSSLGANTPPQSVETCSTGDDLSQVAGFILVSSPSPSGPRQLDIDEIRIGTTWASVTPPAQALIGWSPGSNGSYGPLAITADTTVPLPPDGILHATSVHVAAGKTLRFQRNANNTPVYLLVTGRVQIDGTIDVSGGPGTTTSAGQAGPGGWDGGMPATGPYPPGDGLGPGGGRSGGGRGAPAAHQFPNDPNIPAGGGTYGGPLGVEGGSGGSGTSFGGGGGGGSILVAAGEDIIVGAQGSVIAKGGNAGEAHVNAGSGGRIRLVAPRVLGTGTLWVPGGDAYRGPNMGGWGWVRVDRLDRSPLALNIPIPGYFTSPLSLGAVMKVLPDPAPRLRIKSVDGIAVAPGSGPVTLIRSQNAPETVNVVVEADHFGTLVPTQLYIVPDNAPRSILKATLDDRASGITPIEHTFVATVPPNMRATLHVLAGNSLPANP